jgi:hypothetical protein
MGIWVKYSYLTSYQIGLHARKTSYNNTEDETFSSYFIADMESKALPWYVVYYGGVKC